MVNFPALENSVRCDAFERRRPVPGAAAAFAPSQRRGIAIVSRDPATLGSLDTLLRSAGFQAECVNEVIELGSAGGMIDAVICDLGHRTRKLPDLAAALSVHGLFERTIFLTNGRGRVGFPATVIARPFEAAWLLQQLTSLTARHQDRCGCQVMSDAA